MAKEGFDIANNQHIEEFYQLAVKLNSISKDQLENLSLEEFDSISGGVYQFEYTVQMIG
ncbi:hypothetical protein AB9G23_04615 [Francisella philomiragia]|uniref:hypothetical protein n=1 Tax=Francisella philomiragia TaxID=28110 RepID=UPI0019056AE7|nr:hypothetical protein [Francisella philomiragia]MBK2026156.1 hypothetical protein [Francisella philomiragia]